MRVNRISVVFGAALFCTCLMSINSQNEDDANGKERCPYSCVSYFFCINGTIVLNNTVDSAEGKGKGLDMSVADLMDLRIGGEAEEGRFGEGGCDHYLEKCCKLPDVLPTVQPGTGRTDSSCGQRQEKGVNRITGLLDNEAEYGEFPWMVALLNQDVGSATDGNNIGQALLQCGGSIIHKQVILTAAHCVYQNKTLTVRAGEWDTKTNVERLPIQERKVKEIIIHENFYTGGLLNDIALLVLDSPLEPSEVVSSICLPKQDEIMDNRTCVVTGWGKDKFGKSGKYPVILKKMEVPVVPRDPCLDIFHETELGKYFILHESLICAGGQAGKDSCTGDGGGPLACPSEHNPRVYVQAGIVAWGLGCGDAVPAAYVNVPHFVEWIDTKLSSLGFS